MPDTETEGPGRYNIAIVGTGTSFMPVLDLLTRDDFRGHFPWAGLLGVAESTPRPEIVQRLDQEGVPLYPEVEDLFEAHPEINMIFDMLEDTGNKGDLRKRVPSEVSLVDPFAAMFFWELLVSEKLCSSCQVNLSHARALLDAIIEEVEEDILLLDKRGHIVDLNRNVYERKGLEKRQLLGRHFWEVDDFCRRAGQECPFQKTVRDGVKAEAVYSRVGEDGRMKYLRIYTYPIVDEAGALTHVVEMRRDITDRTRFEQRLQQSERLAAIGELSTYIAHEIRNPLFAIGGFANALLRSEGMGDPERDKVRIILDESRRLDGILKSILNFSRPTEAESGELDVNKVARETMDVLRLGCDNQDVCVRLDLDEDIARAKGNSDLLKQCLINMVKNSLEAMPEGGDLEIVTAMHDDFVLLEVRDSGRGIAAEDQDKVFNPFFTTKKDRGSGLGLAMTKKIVEELGGKVDLKSTPGRGTTVSLYLPPLLAGSEEDEGVAVDSTGEDELADRP